MVQQEPSEPEKPVYRLVSQLDTDGDGPKVSFLAQLFGIKKPSGDPEPDKERTDDRE